LCHNLTLGTEEVSPDLLEELYAVAAASGVEVRGTCRAVWRYERAWRRQEGMECEDDFGEDDEDGGEDEDGDDDED